MAINLLIISIDQWFSKWVVLLLCRRWADRIGRFSFEFLNHYDFFYCLFIRSFSHSHRYLDIAQRTERTETSFTVTCYISTNRTDTSNSSMRMLSYIWVDQYVTIFFKPCPRCKSHQGPLSHPKIQSVRTRTNTCNTSGL